jgi:hypothetical protein
MHQALELDPDDTCNPIFAAVYLAASGHKEEASKVARKNEAVLEASYNLAAIGTQVGDRAKAMKLLRRQCGDIVGGRRARAYKTRTSSRRRSAESADWSAACRTLRVGRLVRLPSARATCEATQALNSSRNGREKPSSRAEA